MVDEYVDKQGLSRLAVGQARGLGRTCRQWDWQACKWCCAEGRIFLFQQDTLRERAARTCQSSTVYRLAGRKGAPGLAVGRLRLDGDSYITAKERIGAIYIPPNTIALLHAIGYSLLTFDLILHQAGSFRRISSEIQIVFKCPPPTCQFCQRQKSSQSHGLFNIIFICMQD